MTGLLVGDTPQVRAWVSAAQAGDRAAFDALVGLYYRSVYRTAMARERLAQVQAAIAALSPKLRDTLLLASSGDHSYDEIAAMLNVPIGTVKWRVAEARRLLNKELS